MERARQTLCSELRGEPQLIYILCHAGEDKMFLYIKSRPSQTEGICLHMKWEKKGGRSGGSGPESSTSWKPVLCNEVLGGEGVNT